PGESPGSGQADRRAPGAARARHHQHEAPHRPPAQGPDRCARGRAHLSSEGERPMSELAFLTIAEASAQIRAKKLSPVEYTKALIAQVERHEPKLNAFIKFTPDIALKEAQAAEAQIAAGRWRGPFHGIPYALKDIVDVAGLATTAHSKVLIDAIART